MPRIDEKDIPDPQVPPQPPKVRLAVYDFDGTCIEGKSPVILTNFLLRRHLLRLRDGVLVGFWGLAYKFHIPVNESWVRSVLFRAFVGQPHAEVDALLDDFYDSHIAHRFRPSIVESIEARKAEGCVLMAVSATFEPIILRMMKNYPFDFEISTRMIVDEHGDYTKQVEGLPVEGTEKVAAIRRFANERYGVGQWEISYAFSDHSSDRPLLFASRNAIAVDPDWLLKRTAKREGWSIISR